MPRRNPWLRACVEPLVFVAVAALVYMLSSSRGAARAPPVCASDTRHAAPSAALPRETVARRFSSALPGDALRLTVASLSTAANAVAKPPATVPAAEAPPHEDSADSAQERVVLLDGGTGIRPANMMSCPLEEAFRCGECTTDSDCPAGRGCVINYAKGVFECADSECEEDDHCFPGSVCRVVAGGAPGPVIRRCLLTGARSGGEPCSRLPATPEEACGEGLLCVNDLCGPPCVPGSREDCPAGYVCENSPRGAACLPDCRKLGCPEGKACEQLGGGVFQCLSLVVDTCDDERPCAQGEHCITRGRKGRAGRFCSAPCEAWKPSSCSEGFVCGVGGPTLSTCYRKCDPRDLGTCPAGWLCTTVTEDLQTWGCLPDFN